MKKVVLAVLLFAVMVFLMSLTHEEFNDDFNMQYDALMKSSLWHHEYTSSQGNEVFWKNDGSEYFVVEVFGDHSEEFAELSL